MNTIKYSGKLQLPQCDLEEIVKYYLVNKMGVPAESNLDFDWTVRNDPRIYGYDSYPHYVFDKLEVTVTQE